MPRAVRTDIVQPDGRHVYLYGDFEPAPNTYTAPAMPNGVYQRRWNALRREWVLVAASRQARTFLPERADCPLCASRPEHSTEIPAARFEAAVFENRFPSMVPWPPAGGPGGGGDRIGPACWWMPPVPAGPGRARRTTSHPDQRGRHRRLRPGGRAMAV